MNNIIQLTNSSYDEHSPQVSGNNVVWSGYDGRDYEIFLYDGTGTVQITNNRYNDLYPQISGNNVVWWGFDGGDYEIFLYDGTGTVQITNNRYNDLSPKFRAITWSGMAIRAEILMKSIFTIFLPLSN